MIRDGKDINIVGLHDPIEGNVAEMAAMTVNNQHVRLTI